MKTIAISDLELYMRCPRAYRLKVTEGILSEKKALSFCKSIATKRVIFWLHKQEKSLEEINTDEIGKQCELFWNEELADPRVDKNELEEIVANGKEDAKAKTNSILTKKEKLLSDIKTWCLSYAQMEKDTNVVYCDVPYECQIGDIIFTGSIDLVRKDANENIEVIKLRTSSQPPNQAFIERDFALTLGTYASWKGNFFSNEKQPNLKSAIAQIPKACYYYLPFLETYKTNGKKRKKGAPKGNPLIACDKSQESLVEFEYEILQIVAGIEMEYYPMRVLEPCGCSICGFRYQCNLFTTKYVSETVIV